MVKKYLLAAAILSAATVGIAESAPIPMAAASRAPSASFINGFSVGVNAGYQLNNIRVNNVPGISAKDIDFDSTAIGAHIDYNHLVSNPLFIGVGFDINSCLSDKKTQSGGANLKFGKKLSSAFTIRTGVVSGPVAFNVNAAVIVSGFKGSANWNQTTTTSTSTKTTQESFNESQTLTGFAPGVGLTFAVAKNVSAGLNYRYEIYQKFKGSKIKESINSHNIFAKLSYHIQ
ncbi:MAG: outer membrane beta-barrel protein [Alphaproteobacteria bacterium]